MSLFHHSIQMFYIMVLYTRKMAVVCIGRKRKFNILYSMCRSSLLAKFCDPLHFSLVCKPLSSKDIYVYDYSNTCIKKLFRMQHSMHASTVKTSDFLPGGFKEKKYPMTCCRAVLLILDLTGSLA